MTCKYFITDPKGPVIDKFLRCMRGPKSDPCGTPLVDILCSVSKDRFDTIEDLATNTNHTVDNFFSTLLSGIW